MIMKSPSIVITLGVDVAKLFIKLNAPVAGVATPHIDEEIVVPNVPVAAVAVAVIETVSAPTLPVNAPAAPDTLPSTRRTPLAYRLPFALIVPDAETSPVPMPKTTFAIGPKALPALKAFSL